MKKLRINLLKLRGAKKAHRGDGVHIKEDCLCIPLDQLYVGEKGVYVDLVAFPRKQEEGNVEFYIKQAYAKNATDKDKESTPIIGDIREFASSF